MPREGVDLRGVVLPALDDTLLRRGVPHEDVARVVRGREVLPVVRVAHTRHLAATLERADLAQLGVEEMHLLVAAADGDGLLVGGDGDGERFVPDNGDLLGETSGAEQRDDLLRRRRSELAVLLRVDVDHGRLHREGRNELALRQVGDADGVVHPGGEERLAAHRETRDLVGVALAGELLARAVDVPLQEARVKGGGEDLAAVERHRRDGAVVSVHDLDGLRGGRREVREVALERERERGLAHPRTRRLHLLGGGAELDDVDRLALRDVPEDGALVRGDGEERLRVRRPRERVHAALVLRGELGDLLAGLAVVEDHLLVARAGGEQRAIGREAHAVDEARVVLDGLFELERRTLEPVDGHVLAGGHDTERTRRLEVASVERLRVSADFADAASRVPHEHRAEALAPFTDDEHTLAVWTPRDVVDDPGEHFELDFERMLLLRRVPDADVALHIARRDVVAARRVLCTGRLAGVLEVHIGLQRILRETIPE